MIFAKIIINYNQENNLLFSAFNLENSNININLAKNIITTVIISIVMGCDSSN